MAGFILILCIPSLQYRKGEPLVLIHNLHGDTVSYMLLLCKWLFWEYPQHHNTKMAARMGTAKVQGV